MADNMNNDRKMKEIIADAVDRQLDKEPELTMTPEKLKKRMAARKVERIKRRARNTGIAAALIVGVGAALVIGGDFDVGADKRPKEEIITEDGVVIEDGGYGAEESNVWTVYTWHDVELLKQDFEDIYIPKYIPGGYTFSEFTIEESEIGEYLYGYTFLKVDNQLINLEFFMPDVALVSLDVEGTTDVIKSLKGDIYIQEDDNKRATIQFDDGTIIRLRGNISNNEITKIIENIYN
ncbi:MAG: DUF4367 domain-containing protein [Anaerofustis stercorihominis]|nr:DUF4367 domain-containing protein [Anaerofustis stercorihominis]